MLTSKAFARNYAQFLTKVVRAARNPQIRNHHALLKALVHTNSNVNILKELLSWLPHSRRDDGLIYKSAPELAEKCCISTRTVYRCVAVLDTIGFTHTVKKANGDPTNHFGLDMQAFLQAIGDVFATNWQTILLWMEAPEPGSQRKTGDYSVRKNVTPETDKMTQSDALNRHFRNTQNVSPESDKMSVSLTPSTSEFKNRRKESEYQTPAMPAHHPVSFSLEKEKMKYILQTSPRNIDMWIQQYGIERVRKVVEAVEQTPGITNRGGWARTALEKDYQLSTNPNEARTYNITPLMNALTSGMHRRG